MGTDIIHKSFTKAFSYASTNIPNARNEVIAEYTQILSVHMKFLVYSFYKLRFSAASRRFMLRTNCNALELRDQIPPLPPEVALAAFDPSVLDHHIMNLCER